MASSQGGSGSGNFDFNAGVGMDFTGFGMQPAAYTDLKGASEGNTSSFFFGDEGIDTTTIGSFDHSFDSIFAPVDDMNNSAAFGMEPLGLDNTAGGASWGNVNAFPTTPTQSFESLYGAQFNSLNKRPLQLEAQDFPQAKRHEAFSPFSSSITTPSTWALETQPTSASSDVGLSDEAADVCATWFSKYNILPSDRHIDSLSQLTSESGTAIRHWFGQALKQGMNGQDSAYKSQTGFTQDPLFNQITNGIAPQQLAISDIPRNHDTQLATTVSQSPLRGGKKGCSPTDDPELLKRDSNKIYQCTRKCGKRYGRKCDWKRNEEEGYPSKSWICSLCVSEGVERVKPCFRKYHFSQHFRNIHPTLNSADYEESSIVHSDTSFPRKCGFCTHRFVSRQDRIDHLADHFKNGKCMLDWNEDEDDNNDSDNMDDDDDNDDRPDNGGGFGNGKPFSPPKGDPRGSGPKYDENGGNGCGPQAPGSGFYQFQVSQFADNDTGCSSPKSDQQIGQRGSHHGQSTEKHHIKLASGFIRVSSPKFDQQVAQRGSHYTQPTGKHHIKPASGLDRIEPCHLEVAVSESRESCDMHGSQCSVQGQCATHGTHVETKRDDPQALAGDVVSKPVTESDFLQLQTMPSHVPPSDGDPRPEHLRMATPPGGVRSESQTRDLEPLLGSLKLLGTGGFSTVDEVVHRETSLRFARKTLKNRERSALEELKNEVDVLQKLRHPHIIRFVDSVSKGGRMSILLSPVADTTLASWLDINAQNRPEGLSRTLIKMLGCLVSSIRYLHEQRPVVKHMDIKPQNILIMQGDQEFPHVVLSDFGISSIGELAANGKAMPLTRQYCAPEVSEGTSRELASDIWSLGCVFVEMATVAFSEDNPNWLQFRQQFGGRKGKYYWQDVPALQGLLSQSLDQATSQTEANVAHTVKQMLSAEPHERPTAPMLTMVFTPAPCCLSWPNEKAAYPGPHEELEMAERLFREGAIGGCPPLSSTDGRPKQQSEPTMCARRWLEECSHEHEACHHQSAAHIGVALPTRLIDIFPNGKESVSVRIVNSTELDAGTSTDYAAVSYLWAEHELTLSTSRLEAMRADLPKEMLSKAINKAITKAQEIGIRYIWVDSLCIVQDSKEDKERECHATADVYRNATLTIVLDQLDLSQVNSDKVNSSSNSPSSLGKTTARSGEHLVASASLPNLTFLTPGFAWDTRAWSLQERLLSRRLLHLGEEQMYWECNSLKASETFPRGLETFRHALSSLLWEKVHTRPDVSLNSRLHDNKPAPLDEVSSGIGNANGRHAQCVCGTNEDDKPLRAKHRNVSPHLLRDCQYIRKEGDGIGDSMEAAQMQLKLPFATADHDGLVDVVKHDSNDTVPAAAAAVLDCSVGGIKEYDGDAVGDPNGLGDEEVYGKNRGLRTLADTARALDGALGGLL